MNYCTLDEAWGNNILKDSRKKRKTKKLYTSKIPPHIYDKSYEEEGHDPHCAPNNKKNYTIKNKHRFDKSRGPKDIYRPKRSSRVNDIDIRYDEANQEYRRYKKETKRNTKNSLNNQEIISQENEMPFLSQSNNEILPYLDSEGEPNLDFLSGDNFNDSYTIQDNDAIQRKMRQLREEQAKVLEEQRRLVEQTTTQQQVGSRPPTPSPSFYSSPSFTPSPSFQDSPSPSNSGVEAFDNYYQNNYVEAFEGNNSELDLLNIEENEDTQEENRINQIQDVEARPAMSYVDEQEDRKSENVIDKLIQKKLNKAKKKKKQTVRPVEEVDTSDSELDTESEGENEEELKYVGESQGDIEYRLNNLNRNMNLIIKKMNSSNLFEGDTEENIHDIILFVLFGIFIIFVLDTIYRFGRNSASK